MTSTRTILASRPTLQHRCSLALLALCTASPLSAANVFNGDVPELMNGAVGDPGTYVINDGNSYLLSASNVSVGTSRTHNQLRVEAGTLSTSSNLRVGSDASGSFNSVVVLGSSSTLAVGNALHIGYEGSSNSLTVSGGGTLTSNASNIGRFAATADNSATVTGVGSLWTSNGKLSVGNEGSRSTLTVSAGGQINVATGGVDIGSAAGSDNNAVTITGAGSWLNISNALNVGNLGSHNSLRILNGGRVTNTSAVIGVGASGQPTQGTDNSVLVSGANSIWETTNLTIGQRSVATTDNTLTIAFGGLVKATGTFTIGNSAGGYLRLDGGHLAVLGDQVSALTAFINNGKVQIGDGDGGWLTQTDPSFYSISYFASVDADTADFTGGLYGDLGGYTILTYTSSIPEASSSALLAAGVALGLAAVRRPRRVRA